MLAELREQLDFFIFFHLGSDADVHVETLQEMLRITIAHQRVRTFRLVLDWERVEELARSPEMFEAYMLDQLTRYRRHRD